MNKSTFLRALFQKNKKKRACLPTLSEIESALSQSQRIMKKAVVWLLKLQGIYRERTCDKDDLCLSVSV